MNSQTHEHRRSAIRVRRPRSRQFLINLLPTGLQRLGGVVALRGHRKAIGHKRVAPSLKATQRRRVAQRVRVKRSSTSTPIKKSRIARRAVRRVMPATSPQDTVSKCQTGSLEGSPATTWLTAKEIATRLRICTKTVDRMVRSGKLTCYRIGNGRTRRFKTSEVERLLQPQASCAVREEALNDFIAREVACR